MGTSDRSIRITTSLKTAAWLCYQGARLQGVEPDEYGRVRLIFADVPVGATHAARPGEQVDLHRYLDLQNSLRTVLVTAEQSARRPR
jgi:hypothetical protein